MTAALLSPHRPNDPAEDEDGKMPFLDHLEDLRRRIIYSCIALAVGMGIAVVFMGKLTTFILAPTHRALPPGSELIFTRPTEPIAVYLNIALIAGLVLAAPAIMCQLWLFVAPALYAYEKKFVIPFVTLSAVGTVAGAAFSHYVLFPAMMGFFATFTLGEMKFMPRVEDVFDLYVNLLTGMVCVFQIPTLAFFLAKIRVVTARFLWRNIKYAVLIVFVVAAVLTPSADPWNQLVFAAPMLVLYIIGIGVAWLAQPKSRNRGSNDAGLRLVFTAAVVDQAWRQQGRRRSGRVME